MQELTSPLPISALTMLLLIDLELTLKHVSKLQAHQHIIKNSEIPAALKYSHHDLSQQPTETPSYPLHCYWKKASKFG